MEKPNLDYIKEISAGNEDFEEKFIGIIKTEFPKEKEEYFKCLTDHQLDESSKVVHKIKHKFGILGMKDSYEFAIKYEEELKLGNIDSNEEFSSILDQVEKFIVKMN